MAARTKKDQTNRVWVYCDCEGTWSHGEGMTRLEIGCGGKNGSKWSIWRDCNGEYDSYEYKTLKEAMRNA